LLLHVEEVVKKRVTEVLVTFSGPVNTAEADSINTYRLATQGKKGSYTAKNAGILKLKSAQYNAATNQVALAPRKPLALTKPVQLLVYGTGKTALFDSYGRPIDGGTSATALLRRNGATITAVRFVPANSQRLLLKPAVVDVLLDHEGLLAVAVKHPARAERRFRDDTATNQRRFKREEPVHQIAQVRADRRLPLLPWTDWGQSEARVPVRIDRAERSSARFTFESFGPRSPWRHSDGSGERKRCRPS